MQTAQAGNLVKINFTGMLEDGTVFITTSDDTPVEFYVGDGTVLKGIDQGVVGMTVGEKRTITLTPDDAYGDRLEALTATIARADFPSNLEPKPGEIYQVKLPTGDMVDLLVTEVDDQSVSLDGNHPLAGKNLRFEIELLAIG
jgi:peptidylprolyl isomerase